MDETKLETRLVVVETTINFIAKDVADIKDNHLKKIYDKIECIVIKMSKPRLPLWTTFLLTGLFSLVTGLIVAFLKK